MKINLKSSHIAMSRQTVYYITCKLYYAMHIAYWKIWVRKWTAKLKTNKINSFHFRFTNIVLYCMDCVLHYKYYKAVIYLLHTDASGYNQHAHCTVVYLFVPFTMCGSEAYIYRHFHHYYKYISIDMLFLFLFFFRIFFFMLFNFYYSFCTETEPYVPKNDFL